MARKTAGHGPRTLMLATASSLILSALLMAAPASAQKAEPKDALKAEKASTGAAVTWEDILNDQNTDKDVLMYGMGIKAQRYSGLDKINTKNVSLLKPRWSFSFGDEKQRGQEGQALVHDGVIYITASYSRIFALDAKTGKKLWSFSARLPDDIRPCCDVVSRGAAIYNGKIYFGALDASMYALDAKTGKVVWSKKFDDHAAGYAYTGAPNIIKDKKTGKVVLIHGNSGDEFGAQGKLYGRDPETGEEIWMRPLVEGHMAASPARTRPRRATPRRRPGPTTRTARRSRPGTTAAAPPGRPASTTRRPTPSSSAPATRPRGTTITVPAPAATGSPTTASTPRARSTSTRRTASRWASSSTPRTTRGITRATTRSSCSTWRRTARPCASARMPTATASSS